MLAHADLQRAAGESSAGAFARLVKERDPTVERLWAACDLARTYEHHGDTLREQRATAAELLNEAASNLEKFVSLSKRADESTEAAYARLWREDSQFSSLYGTYDRCRRFAAS